MKISLAALLLCAFAACSKQKGTQMQEKIIPVKVMEIIATQTANEQNYVGTVEESVAVSLSFSNTGTVEQVLVSEGQRVAKGQLLATLNATTAQNAYDASQAKLVQAQDAYDRLVKVHESGSLPDIKFVEIETGLQQAKSMAAVSKKSLDDCKMYAPRNGVIATRSIEVGESAMPGMSAFKLVSVDKVNVKIPVPENEIGGVQTGQAASITVPALNNAVFTGKIEMKGVAANALSHTYEAKIGIDNNTQMKDILLPGMVCKVSLATESSITAFVVPNHAIQISPDGKCFVWLAEDNTARRCFVKTGSLANDGIVVTEGLQAGSKIIVEGFQKISEGMKISITN
ncbi:MAG: efflux RND transporter periplasmic adaptor subunit [Tannerellaceae bacterium]|nr:efflux RND transporter periplasmic adaptor subunit [Tannerellaceae bacterium]